MGRELRLDRSCGIMKPWALNFPTSAEAEVAADRGCILYLGGVVKERAPAAEFKPVDTSAEASAQQAGLVSSLPSMLEIATQAQAQAPAPSRDPTVADNLEPTP